jgi:hypothetical protein
MILEDLCMSLPFTLILLYHPPYVMVYCHDEHLAPVQTYVLVHGQTVVQPTPTLTNIGILFFSNSYLGKYRQ